MNLTYEKCGDYLIQNLIRNPEPEGELRKLGLMRKHYLKEHLLSVQEQAETRFDMLVEQMGDWGSVNEKLKASDQMRWVRRMNNIRYRVEEIVREEIIFCCK